MKISPETDLQIRLALGARLDYLKRATALASRPLNADSVAFWAERVTATENAIYHYEELRTELVLV